jgi:hypothetical protein
MVLTAMLAGTQTYAQVTTSSITGIVTDEKGEPLPGATVIAIHEPSGSRYGTTTNAAGRYNLPGTRVGGPYRITATFVGYKEQVVEGITANLGTAANADFKLADESAQLQEVVVTTSRSDVFSSNRTGAATTIGKEAINTLPTVSRSINDFTRLTPQASGSSFGGQDNRLNNITVDGAFFNNSFGLSGQPGGRTSVSPISIDAIEEVQVNIAPYDVRQSNFTGAGINAVTRSGTNDVSGSAFYIWQNNNFLGDRAKDLPVVIGQFNKQLYGFRLGGPLIKNKLFFFVNGEIEQLTQPATTWVASRPGAQGQVSRTLATDLDALSSFLGTNFQYETGPYENFDAGTYANKFLTRLDWNINDKHKFNISYRQLVSGADILTSNSNSLGFGNRRTNINSMAYRNSGYVQNEDNWALIGELNSTFSSKMSNQLILGYSFSREDRGQQGANFPTIDILQTNQTYIATGLDPFTPKNRLNYGTFQLQDNFTYYAGKHTVTAGVSLQRIRTENLFFPGSLGVYIFSSLADFYTAANAFVANPSLTTSPVAINRFQFRYSLLPNGADPLQILQITYPGVYLQDEYNVTPNLKITGGIRVDVPFFSNTALENPAISRLSFRDETGSVVQYNTGKLPNASPLWSPRVGFNWDISGKKTTQLRGGTGIFTGNPPFVWISNQVGNNGILTALIEQNNTRNFPFRTDMSGFIPANPTGNTSFDIAVTDPKFKFPQIWRSNFAVDQRLPFGLIGTLEFIYSKNVNAVKYINANLEPATATFNYAGDTRPRFPGSPGLFTAPTTRDQALRINDAVVQNIVLQNTNQGSVYSITAELKKPFAKGFYGSLAYNFSEARDLTSAGSIAAGSWTGNFTVRGNNLPDLAFSDNDQRHRVIGSLSYRLDYGGKFGGSTAISLFYNAFNLGRYSYRYGGDLNGDGVNNNDLLYVPGRAADLTFSAFTRTYRDANNVQQTVTFSPEQQSAAYEAFINQDPYLRTRRGQYTERNGALLPWVARADLSIIQEFFVRVGKNGKRNTLQFRGDVLNVGNLLNNAWGVARIVNVNQPLSVASVNATTGVPVFQFSSITGPDGVTPVLPSTSFRTSTGTSDVYQAQFGLRYIFN